MIDEPLTPRVRHRVVDAQRHSGRLIARRVLAAASQWQLGVEDGNRIPTRKVRADVGKPNPTVNLVEAATDNRVDGIG